MCGSVRALAVPVPLRSHNGRHPLCRNSGLEHFSKQTTLHLGPYLLFVALEQRADVLVGRLLLQRPLEVHLGDNPM